MSKVKEREIKTGPWALSKHEYSVARRYAILYGDWLDQYNALKDSVGAIVLDGMPKGGGATGNPTQALAIKRAELRAKMEVVENAAKQADPEIWPWILKAATEEGCSYATLSTPSRSDGKPIPCGKDMYYDRRRKFYWILAQKIL